MKRVQKKPARRRRTAVDQVPSPYAGVLTMRGHWAALVLSGLKTVEIQRRPLSTSVGKRCAICCSRTGMIWAEAIITEERVFLPEELALLQLWQHQHHVPPHLLANYGRDKEGRPCPLYAYAMTDVRALKLPMQITKLRGSVVWSRPTVELSAALPDQAFSEAPPALPDARRMLHAAGAKLTMAL